MPKPKSQTTADYHAKTYRIAFRLSIPDTGKVKAAGLDNKAANVLAREAFFEKIKEECKGG